MKIMSIIWRLHERFLSFKSDPTLFRSMVSLIPHLSNLSIAIMIFCCCVAILHDLFQTEATLTAELLKATPSFVAMRMTRIVSRRNLILFNSRHIQHCRAWCGHRGTQRISCCIRWCNKVYAISLDPWYVSEICNAWMYKPSRQCCVVICYSIQYQSKRKNMVSLLTNSRSVLSTWADISVD